MNKYSNTYGKCSNTSMFVFHSCRHVDSYQKWYETTWFSFTVSSKQYEALWWTNKNPVIEIKHISKADVWIMDMVDRAVDPSKKPSTINLLTKWTKKKYIITFDETWVYKKKKSYITELFFNRQTWYKYVKSIQGSHDSKLYFPPVKSGKFSVRPDIANHDEKRSKPFLCI